MYPSRNVVDRGGAFVHKDSNGTLTVGKDGWCREPYQFFR